LAAVVSATDDGYECGFREADGSGYCGRGGYITGNAAPWDTLSVLRRAGTKMMMLMMHG
ncbi:hypothetical protein Dimus_029245, partial [Dionaea muscipula]